MKKLLSISLALIIAAALFTPPCAALDNGTGDNTSYFSVSSGGVTIYPETGLTFRGVRDPESGEWLEQEYGPGAEGVKNVPLIKYKGEMTENSVSHTVYVIKGYELPNGSMDIGSVNRFFKNAGKGVYRVTAYFTVIDSELTTFCKYAAPFDVEVEKDPVYNGEYDVVQDGISYLDCGAYCEIVYAAGSLTGDVVIPSSVYMNGRDLPVRSIRKWAFQDNLYIQNVVLPDGLTTIGDFAFENCSLQGITIPESVTSIGIYAFKNCSQLKNVTLPENIEEIDYGTFFGCSSLESITIPENVTRIGIDAFNRCTGLTSITIPDSVTTLMDSAFENCTGLKTVIIGSGYQTIYIKAFTGCDAVDTLIISENNPKYYSKGNCIIDKNTNIIYLMFKNSEIPEDKNIIRIGNRALSYFKNEKTVHIPVNIIVIDDEVFNECSSLETVYYDGTIEQWEEVVIGSYNKYLRSAKVICTNGTVIGDEEIYDNDDPDPEVNPLMGDCSGDGEVDNKDVVILFRYVSGNEKAGDESVYDYNGDGEVNNKDVAELFRALSGENAPTASNEKQITEIVHYNVKTYSFGENSEGNTEPEYDGKEFFKIAEESKKDGMENRTITMFGKDYTLKYSETYDYGLYDEKYDEYHGTTGGWFKFGEKTGRLVSYLNRSDKPAEDFVPPVNESSDQQDFVDYAKSLLLEYFDTPTDDCDVKIKNNGSEYRITFYKIFSGVYRVDNIEVQIKTDGSVHSVKSFTCEQKFERFKNIKINADWLNRRFGGSHGSHYLSYEYLMRAIPDGYNLWVLVDTNYTYEEDGLIWSNGNQYIVKVAEAYKELPPDTENGKQPVYLTVKCGYNTICPDAYALWTSMYIDEEGEWIEGGGIGAADAKSVPKINIYNSDIRVGYKNVENGVKVSYRVEGYEDGKFLTLKELNSFLFYAKGGGYRVVAVVNITGRNVGVQYEESCWEYPFDVIK